MKIDIGLKDNSRKTVAEALGRVLADSYTLYLKTHNFHWNVTGPNFYSLHKHFEELYTELAGAVDELAERIRREDFVHGRRVHARCFPEFFGAQRHRAHSYKNSGRRSRYVTTARQARIV